LRNKAPEAKSFLQNLLRVIQEAISSKKPSAAVNIEFHNALVPHFQQEGLASFLVHDIGSYHDLTNLERLYAQSAQDIVPIIQHAFP
jgi:hypothetical protein